MHFKILTLLFTVSVYFDVTAAERLTIYRWVDKENIVHFSQHQPAHDDYIEMSMINNQKSTATMAKNLTGQGLPIDDSALTNKANTEQMRIASNDKCVTARENINTLENFDNIQYKDEQGNIKILTALEKQQQLAMNTKQAEVYCLDSEQ
ncbi:hypothetical protein SAMN05216262_1012 [Colwellia chukchiensis]|uniref:DUF4124 domain-containing protein n=1 Tax=Colwellia chukchiensis TaxID=641665 RepID=A0A1H7FU29_9GAMM|nr:hypothetical protein [Colwellia chukchiensis]SEK29583.1 hypothetical protein SAMN05216262_1012 [Colwellia chukchiensis]